MWQRVKSFLFENRNVKQTVAKNTTWLFISNAGGRLIKAVIVIYGARVLGAAGYGVFSYAVTLAGFFTLFVDPGINAVLIRDGAKASVKERWSLFSTTLVMKAVAMIVSIVIVIGIAPFFSTLPGAKALLPLVALIIIFDGTREFLASLFRAEEKMQWDAAAFLLANLGIAIFGFIFLHIATTPKSFTASYVAGTAVGALAAAWFLRHNFKKIIAKVSFGRMAGIIKIAWPFAVTGALAILLTNTDILIISWMRTAADVGVYAAAIRIVQVLYFIPAIVQLSTLPAFARLAKHDNEKFRTALEHTLTLIFLVSIPISLGGAVLGTQVMGFVFGPAYVAGGVALSILMLGLLFDYATAIVSNAVFAYNHQRSLIICAAIGGFGNVLFDLLLIPRWGIAGSAVATLCAQILSNSYLWHIMNKLNQFHVLPKVGKIAAAGAAMAVATVLLSAAQLHVALNIMISGILYFVILFITREPLLAEIRKIIAVAKPPDASSG